MRHMLLGLGLLLGLAWPTYAGESPHPWRIRVLRMEGAAVSVREAAEVMQSISADVARRGRVQQVARLRSAADRLHRQVVSARLAADMLHEGIEVNEGP